MTLLTSAFKKSSHEVKRGHPRSKIPKEGQILIFFRIIQTSKKKYLSRRRRLIRQIIYTQNLFETGHNSSDTQKRDEGFFKLAYS